MITEDYVSFETAVILKEHGFNEKCNYVYDNAGNMIVSQNFMEGESSVDCDDIDSVAKRNGWITYTQGEYAYLCPTLQRVMKWLRKIHNIALDTEWEHLWYAYVKPMTSKPHEDDCYQCESVKYEEACEEAIKYCLKNLI